MLMLCSSELAELADEATELEYELKGSLPAGSLIRTRLVSTADLCVLSSSWLLRVLKRSGCSRCSICISGGEVCF